MSETPKRSTVYFEPDLHKALRMKAAETGRSFSETVNESVRATLGEDGEDLEAFESRKNEKTVSYETMLKELKANGKI